MNDLKRDQSFPDKEKGIRLAASDLYMAFGFMFALAVLCFTLGVRLGKKQATSDFEKSTLSQKIALEKKSNLLEEMRVKIIDKSQQFQVQEVKPKSLSQVETQTEPKTEVKTVVETETEKFKVRENVFKSEPEVKKGESKIITKSKVDNINSNKALSPDLSTDPLPFLETGNPSLKNSYTIVIGDFLEYDQASLFAQAFKERGYTPFLQKYSRDGIDKIRVSLGSYTSEEKALKFLSQKSRVFTKGKYKISKFL